MPKKKKTSPPQKLEFANPSSKNWFITYFYERLTSNNVQISFDKSAKITFRFRLHGLEGRNKDGIKQACNNLVEEITILFDQLLNPHIENRIEWQNVITQASKHTKFIHWKGTVKIDTTEGFINLTCDNLGLQKGCKSKSISVVLNGAPLFELIQRLADEPVLSPEQVRYIGLSSKPDEIMPQSIILKSLKSGISILDIRKTDDNVACTHTMIERINKLFSKVKIHFKAVNAPCSEHMIDIKLNLPRNQPYEKKKEELDEAMNKFIKSSRLDYDNFIIKYNEKKLRHHIKKLIQHYIKLEDSQIAIFSFATKDKEKKLYKIHLNIETIPAGSDNFNSLLKHIKAALKLDSVPKFEEITLLPPLMAMSLFCISTHMNWVILYIHFLR